MISINETDVLEKMSYALERVCGINSTPYVRPIHSAPIKVFSVHLPENGDSLLPRNYVGSGSSSISLQKAFLAGIGEKLERYCLYHNFRDSKVRKFSLNHPPADLNHLDLNYLTILQGFLPFQFEQEYFDSIPWDANSEMRWIQAQRMLTGSKIWIPEKTAIFSFEDKDHFKCSSNGLALALTPEKAVLSASYELIERDNFMMFWWRKEKPLFVDYRKDLKELHPELYRALGPWIEKIELLYLPGSFGIPSFYPVFRSENKLGHPAFAIAGSANLDPVKALVRSLSELGSIINDLVQIHSRPVSRPSLQSHDFNKSFDSFRAHYYNYSFDEMANSIFFYDEIKKVRCGLRLKDIKNLEKKTDLESLQFLKTVFESSGFDPIVLDQTTDDLKELGFYVYRVLDKDAIPLNNKHVTRFWGHKRLYSDLIRTHEDLNQYPHPYP